MPQKFAMVLCRRFAAVFVTVTTAAATAIVQPEEPVSSFRPCSTLRFV